MKKTVLFLMTWFQMSLAFALSPLPNHQTIHFNLNNEVRGESCPKLLNNAQVTIKYDYDFDYNWGTAELIQLQETSWTEALHPLGLSDIYGFMSDMAPKTIHLNGGEVVIYRVIFNISKANDREGLNFGDSQVLLMIGAQGDCIMSTNIVNVRQ